MPDIFLYGGETNPADIRLRDPTTASGSGVTASLSVTLDAVTLSSTTVAPIAGALSKTLDDVTLASTASVAVVANLNVTLGAVTLSSTASVPIAAALSKTLDDVTLSSAGIVLVVATLSKTLDAVTLVADGTVTSATITADLNVLLADVTLLSDATNFAPIAAPSEPPAPPISIPWNITGTPRPRKRPIPFPEPGPTRPFYWEEEQAFERQVQEEEEILALMAMEL